MANLREVPRNKLESAKKDLEEALTEINVTIDSIKVQFEARLSEPVSKLNELQSKINEINNEINRRSASDKTSPSVSDHALVRYIERVLGFDVESIREDILKQTLNAIVSGANSVKKEGMVFQIKNNTVVTVTSAKSKKMQNRK